MITGWIWLARSPHVSCAISITQFPCDPKSPFFSPALEIPGRWVKRVYHHSCGENNMVWFSQWYIHQIYSVYSYSCFNRCCLPILTLVLIVFWWWSTATSIMVKKSAISLKKNIISYDHEYLFWSWYMCTSLQTYFPSSVLTRLQSHWASIFVYQSISPSSSPWLTYDVNCPCMSEYHTW